MITVKLIGGLGNQLFQYALGRAIEFETKQEVQFDITELLSRLPRKNFTNRNFELSNLVENIRLTPLSRLSLASKLHNTFFIFNRLSLQWLKLRRQYIAEKLPFDFDKSVFDLRGNYYLNGYWQSEEYFSKFLHSIRQELLSSYKPNESSKKFLEKINEGKSVSIHIRRGDYVNLGLNEICNQDYYNDAIKYYRSILPSVKFFVFSDDLNWAYQMFNDPDMEVVDGNQQSPINDMYLMSKCNHHIIANSTFSWWATLLNDHKDKIIVSPKRWNCHAKEIQATLSAWVRL